MYVISTGLIRFLIKNCTGEYTLEMSLDINHLSLQWLCHALWM